jgi:hypothetical protein
MSTLKRFIEISGISEDEALSALVAAISPPQLGPLRQNWMRQPQFGHSAPDTAILRSLFDAADYRCTECGSQLRLGLDHRNSDGTDHSLENLQVLCFSCNRARGRGGAEKNLHHGRRLVRAIIELFDETGTFPSNKDILTRSGLTQVGRPELVKYLKRRLSEEAGRKKKMPTHGAAANPA